MIPPISVLCPLCYQQVDFPGELQGQVHACPACHQLFQVPVPALIATGGTGTRMPARPKPAPVTPKAGGWFVQKDGKQFGPYPVETLQRLADAGELKADCWVVMPDTDACVLAATVPGLVFRIKRNATKSVPAGPARVSAPTPAPSRMVAPASTSSRPAAAVKRPEVISVPCPSCRSHCAIPKPQGPAMFSCPKCRQPFRAAPTAVGIVAARVAAAATPVHQANTATATNTRAGR
ncbi:MAG: DUF4339 domain-containing protein [Gemmataceae bacterium]|nr:DUF4339 domain-containing protein [Gemmataceae bacterium]